MDLRALQMSIIGQMVIWGWYQLLLLIRNLFTINSIINNNTPFLIKQSSTKILKDHLVRTIMLLKTKLGTKIILHQWRSINNLEDTSIHLLLISLACITNNGSLGFIIGKELFFAVFTISGDTCKVRVVKLGNIDG